jgi:hypothetical protein
VLQQQLGDAELVVQSLEQMAARQREINQGGQQGVYACPLTQGSPTSSIHGDFHGPAAGGTKGLTSWVPWARMCMRSPRAWSHGIPTADSAAFRCICGAMTATPTSIRTCRGFAPRGAVGTRVHAGEHIAYNGNTGMRAAVRPTSILSGILEAAQLSTLTRGLPLPASS